MSDIILLLNCKGDNYEFELNIIRSIQSIANPFLDGLFQLITMFGEEAILIPLIAVIYWTFNKKMGEYIAYSSLTSVLINGAVKDVFKAKRPIGEPGIRSLRVETATGYSFPSGHTQGTASFWGAIAIYLKKNYMYAISGLIIVLVNIKIISRSTLSQRCFVWSYLWFS